MFQRIDAFLAARTRRQLCIGLPLLVALIGSLDLASGYELSFSIFYVLPVGIGAWAGSKRMGICLAVLSGVTWLVVDRASEHQYSYPAIAYWNACVRMGFFMIISLLLSTLRHSLDYQRSLARTDPLTGLLNTRAFQQHCDQLFKLTNRYGHPLTLGYLDLDGFKGINDKLGHSVGDLVLKSVASSISSRLRSTDHAARMGGDEFALLLPETGLDGARCFFAEMHEKLLEVASSNQWPLGFSFGVAVFSSPGATTDEAISFADTLMYHVKSSGKNSIHYEEFTSTKTPAPGQ